MFGIKHFIILSFVISLIHVGCNSTSKNDNEKTINGKPKLVFEKEMYNFGEVKQGDVIGKYIHFKNEGKGVLTINSVTGSFDCLDFKYSSKPVMPNDKGKIEVVFDADGFHGRQVKFFKVYSNDSLANTKELMIWVDIK